MDKIKDVLFKFWEKIKGIFKKLNKVKEIKASSLADILTILALIIIFGTTFMLNVYIAMYLLAIILFLVSYFVAKGGGK